MTDTTVRASARVRDLLAQMTLEEKTAQLVGYWVDQGGEVVAPLADEMVTTTKYADATTHGLGHLTRVYGTRPVDPVERAAWLWREQRRLQTETRLGIPAIVHEECLTGLAAWQAATYPTPRRPTVAPTARMPRLSDVISRTRETERAARAARSSRKYLNTRRILNAGRISARAVSQLCRR